MTLKNIDFKTGIVTYDGFEVNPLIPYEQQTTNLEQDLLQVSYLEDKYIIDIGWGPDYDPEGSFVIRIIKDCDWDKPLYEKETRSFPELENYLQECINLIEEKIK
jgi:hypothetical protein